MTRLWIKSLRRSRGVRRSLRPKRLWLNRLRVNGLRVKRLRDKPNVVPLLRYLDCKVAKYADPRHPGSYVELVRRRTRIKVRTISLLASLDETIKDLRLKNDALRKQLVILRKVQKAVHKMQKEKFEDAKKELVKQREKLSEDLDSEQAQNRILSKELVRQTRLLEQCQSARQADEELICHLQSQCGELRAQRAEAEL
ncbi:hypothetical protein AXG93_3833s1020 [Marchantia polymorpha subsp. ruderalis]|uniref:Uncharacterized protein n=1 Tax=Marchantia polymorpha subsp. ruderalis TaxID=1480154 RepID=A0A176VJX8_MARPO|nr:hypothetical protein AXG93_3833s1020 [Marchantia polymorpha subsp. ruderalis]